MALIKDIYSREFYSGFAKTLEKCLPGVTEKTFVQAALGDGFATMEWKDRMKHSTRLLHRWMPEDFPRAAKKLNEIITLLTAQGASPGGLVYIFLADYIETYGLDHFDVAVRSFESVTRFVSCEFAVRPFVIKYEQPMIDRMTRWSEHQSEDVRRLSSEGSRPRLPWGVAIPWLKKDPTPLLPLLTNLRADPSLYVRKSVANNLNDISKDNPDFLLSFAAKWKGTAPDTDWILKHASRTLLKKGHAEILAHHGFDNEGIASGSVVVATAVVKTGGALRFSFTVANKGATEKKIRLEYAVYYLKASGEHGRKVFKISERIFAAGEKSTVDRAHSFRQITTRTFYPGKHYLALIVNGAEQKQKPFVLK